MAICSVIAFHYFPDHFPNGYLGVDLYAINSVNHLTRIFRFFVLSGYLMSMMLSRHIDLNMSVILDFLYRRVKRIVPLYYLVVAVSTGTCSKYSNRSLATIYLCPCTDLIFNMVSAERAVWLTTNMHWNKKIDYFKIMGGSHNLFTHTWSLCLEMQFYLIFPLFWWLQTRLAPTKRMVFLHIISKPLHFLPELISGGVSLYYYFISDSKKAFNSMFCRIWQFLFGIFSLCFPYVLKRQYGLLFGGAQTRKTTV